MRVLFLTPDLSEGYGIVAYNKNLLSALGELGVGVEVIELRKEGGIFWKIVFSLQSLIKTITFRPKIIFCAHINFSPLCYFFKKVFGKNYVVFTHGADVWDVKSGLKRKGLKTAKKVVTVSTYTKEKLVEQFQETESRIFLLPNTVDSEKFSPKEKNFKLISRFNISNKKVIFTLSRISEKDKHKGHDVVVRALPKVVSEIPNVVYILGGSGDGIKGVKQLIKDNNVEDRVILPGFLTDEELVDYYNLCDVFVMPSKGEGFGIVFLEALACGRPVVAGNQDGSRDPLLDGELGILVDPNNVDEIAEAIVKILGKKISGNLLDGEFLRKKMLSVYGFDKFKEGVQNLINELQE